MKFILKPSLEHMSLVQIVICLWNENDVRALIMKHSSDDLSSTVEWKTIEKIVIEKVSQLSLPQPLKEKVLGFIKPIGLELLEWMKYHARYYRWMHLISLDVDLNLPAHTPAELCWTSQGTVDRKRTAEVLVRDENLNVFTRYILACDYCLEDDIFRFWNDLPENVKDYDWSDFKGISFWSDNMKKGGVGHISYKFLFYWSTFFCNKVSAKYFLQKLTPQEKEEYLEDIAESIDNSDVLCFLLSEMEEEKQKKVFKNSPVRVLQSFLQWPWQSFFIGVGNCMWDFLSKDDYDEILGDIIGKVKEGYKDYNYKKLFRDFWQKSPSVLKYSLIEDIDKSWLLQCLFDIKDKENIRLILKDANLTAKEKLIYSYQISRYLTDSIQDNEWDFLQFFIRECLPSKNEMFKFKVKFEKSVMHSYFKEHFTTKKQEWDQLYHFSDDSICEYVKRSVEEGESSSSKRFQNLHSNTCLKMGKELF